MKKTKGKKNVDHIKIWRNEYPNNQRKKEKNVKWTKLKKNLSSEWMKKGTKAKKFEIGNENWKKDKNEN